MAHKISARFLEQNMNVRFISQTIWGKKGNYALNEKRTERFAVWTSVVFRNLMSRQYIVVFLIKIIRLECFYLTIIGFRFVESVQRSISFQWIPFKWHSVAFMSLLGITINAFVLTLIIFLTIWIYFNP